MYATVSFNHSNVVQFLPDTSSAYCAAQILGGLFYAGMHLAAEYRDVRERRLFCDE